MDKETLLKLIEDDDLGLLDIKPVSSGQSSEDERLIASFEDINQFVTHHQRQPQLDPTNIQESMLAQRLKGIQADPKKYSNLKPYDTHGLLDSGSTLSKVTSIDDILSDDDLGILEDDSENIFTLKHVPKEIDMPEYKAQRKPCKKFELYKPIFKACQLDLSNGQRTLSPFSGETEINAGDFFVLKGVLLYIAHKGEREKRGKREKIDYRLKCIYENGTESDLLMRSLARELYRDGRRVSMHQDNVLQPSIYETIDEEDVSTGHIYILRSLSSNPSISSIQHLYKIGYTEGDIETRIQQAAKKPTYLMADVEIVATYQTFNMTTQKFENLLHRFFNATRLQIDFFDGEGQRIEPREWFVVPLNIIDEAIHLLVSRDIVDYKYDSGRVLITKK